MRITFTGKSDFRLDLTFLDCNLRLVIQQIFLQMQPAGIAHQLPVCADDAVTRGYDRNRIAVVRHADRADAFRILDSDGDVLITSRLTARDLAQSFPHFQLERCSGCIQRQLELLALPAEVLLQLTLPFLAICSISPPSRHASRRNCLCMWNDKRGNHKKLGCLFYSIYYKNKSCGPISYWGCIFIPRPLSISHTTSHSSMMSPF